LQFLELRRGRDVGIRVKKSRKEQGTGKKKGEKRSPTPWGSAKKKGGEVGTGGNHRPGGRQEP